MKKEKIKSLFICISVVALLNSCSSSKSSSSGSSSKMKNMVARMEVKEPIPGVCDNGNVLVILPFPGNGQVKAKAPKTVKEITDELNEKVAFLKDKPDYEDKGMVNLIVNCKGEMVRCQIDNKTKSPDLDSQIVAVFAEMKTWVAATVNNSSVDTAVLYSFTITKGKFTVS